MTNATWLMVVLGGSVMLLLMVVIVLQVATLPSPISVPGPFRVVNSPLHGNEDLRVEATRCMDDSKIAAKQTRYQTVTTRLLTNVKTNEINRFPELSPLSDIGPGCMTSVVTISFLPDDIGPGTYVLSGVVSLRNQPRISSASANWTTEAFEIIP